MTQDLNTQIKIGADASGVEAGVASAKRSLASLGQTAEQTGRTGGEGLKKLGAGGEESARRLDSVTKNMVASLQRQIAAVEAGGTATRQYQESIARLRGADVNALKPYLDHLDAARDKAEKAARANAGLSSSIGSLGGVAALAGGAVSALASSITLGAMVGFVRSINDGIDALNDIKDATGSTIENISALEDVAKRTGHNMDVVTTSMIKLNQVLADAKPGSAQALALEAIGLSAKELRALDPAEALLKTAQALTEFEDDANKARLVQELFGKSIREVMPFLNDLAEKGALVAKVTTQQADEAAKAAKEWSNFEKEALDLARVMTGPMVSSMNEMIAKFKEGRAAGRSFFSMGAENYANWVKDFWQGEEQVSITPLGRGGGAGRGSVNPAIARPSVGEVPDTAALKAAADAAKKAAEDYKKELQEQAKLMAELSGLTGSFAEDWNRLTAVYKAGGLSLEQLTKAQADLLAKQPAIKAAADAEIKAREDALKAAQAAADARRKEADGITAWIQAQEAAAAQALQGIRGRITSLQDEEEAVTLSTALNISLAEAVERVAVARLREKQAGFYEGSEGYEQIEREIEARLKLADLVAGKAARDASIKAAKEAQDAWQRTADDINRSLTDALMRGFESGKDFAQNLRDTIKNMFGTLVLRPIISAVMTPVAGAVNSLLYGGAGGGGSGLSLLGTGANVISGLQGTTGMLGTIGGWLGLNTTASNVALATSLGIDTASATAAATGAASAGGGFLSTLGAAAPWIAGAAALLSIISGLDDSGTYHTGGAAQYNATTGLSSGQSGADYNIGFGRVESGAQTISAVGTIAKGIGSALDGIAIAFGKKAGYEVATAFADDTSKDGAWGALRISKDGQELLNWENTRQSKWAPKEFGDGQEGYQQYLAAVAKDTRQVLLDMDLPSWAQTMLQSLGDTADMDALTAVITQIGVVQTAFVGLGETIEGFAGMTDKAFEAILKASGGIDALSANASTYYDNFYTADERKAKAREQVQAQLDDLGIKGINFDDPSARQQYRAAVEEALKRANVQAANREAFSAALANMDMQAISAGNLGDMLKGLGGEGDATPEALAALATSLTDLGQSATGLDDFQKGVTEYINANAEALGLEGDAAATAAALLGLSGAFAQVTQSAEDTQAAMEAQAKAAQTQAMRNLQEAYERERKVLEDQLKSLDKTRTALEQQQSLQQESLDLITGVFDLVRSNARELYADVSSTAAMQAVQGQLFIEQALSAAQSTGYLPDQDKLSEAISAARAGITNGAYSTQFERDRDTLVLAGRLSGLEAISGKQKTAAELQLELLQQQVDAVDAQTEAINQQIQLQQDTLDKWQEQIDISNGVYDATLSVEQAIQALTDLMFPVNTKTPYQVTGTTGGGSGGAVFGGGGGNGGTAATSPYSRPVSLGTAGVAYSPVTDQAEVDKLNSLAGIYHKYDGTGDLTGLLTDIKNAGGTIRDLEALSGYYQSDWERAAAAVGIPAFAEGGLHAGGLRMVGERGWEIEATGPARYWNQQQLGEAMASGGGAVVGALSELSGQVARLAEVTSRTADKTEQLANQFDQLTAGGNVMRTKAIA